jgi:hypothetical protein
MVSSLCFTRLEFKLCWRTALTTTENNRETNRVCQHNLRCDFKKTWPSLTRKNRFISGVYYLFGPFFVSIIRHVYIQRMSHQCNSKSRAQHVQSTGVGHYRRFCDENSLSLRKCMPIMLVKWARIKIK